jgi:hypothetical protein
MWIAIVKGEIMLFKRSITAMALSCAALTAPSLSCAADRQEGFGFVMEADLEYGGDAIATVNFTDGSDQDIKAGQGVSVAMGAHYRSSAESPFSVRGTLGYKYTATAASNADINLGRVVFEVLGNYAWDNNWWVGAGVTRHSNIKLHGDGFGPNAAFDDATGPTVEVGWRWIALSYTQIEYTDEFGSDWDASSLGLTFTSKF